jgi:hypothetical protein
MLEGKINPLLICDEGTGLTSINESILLQLTQRDCRLSIEPKYKDQKDIHYKGTMIIIGNEDFRDSRKLTDEVKDVYENRIETIHFNTPIPSDKIRPEIRYRLRDEYGGILMSLFDARYENKIYYPPCARIERIS